MKKEMKNNIKDLKSYCELSTAISNNPDTALETLWALKVRPFTVLTHSDIDTESEEFKELCKQLDKDYEKLPLSHINEESLPIKNSVVRDVVGEKCRSFLKATAEQALIHKVIHLLRSERENQFCGGLKALGFNYQEASYIKETCNGEDISLYLSHLFYGTAKKIDIEKNEEKEKEEIKNSSSIPSSVLLSNRELVEDFFHIARELPLSAEVLISKRDLIMAFFETCDKLSKKGIDIKYLIEKEGKIKEIFAMLDEL